MKYDEITKLQQGWKASRTVCPPAMLQPKKVGFAKGLHRDTGEHRDKKQRCNRSNSSSICQHLWKPWENQSSL
jgi:hypothetical protein